MVLFEGDQIREGGPNPLADIFRGRRTKSAEEQIRGGPNPLVHRRFQMRGATMRDFRELCLFGEWLITSNPIIIIQGKFVRYVWE